MPITRRILGCKVLDRIPTCRREIPNTWPPNTRGFCDAYMIEIAPMDRDGYDPWLVKFKCPKCGQEEWINRMILPLQAGGER